MERSRTAKILAVLTVLAAAAAAPHLFENKNTVNAQFTSGGNTLAEVELEVADTSSERKKGLMYRRNLEERHGMIFKYPWEGERSFWMKNTYIPLDIIFLDSNMTVINIEKAEPEPDMPEEDLTSYRSEEPAKYVVELNQGFSENHSIEKGSRLEIEK